MSDVAWTCFVVIGFKSVSVIILVFKTGETGVPDVVHAVFMSLHQRFDVSGRNGIKQQHFCLLTGHSQHRPKHRHENTLALAGYIAASASDRCPAASL